MDADLFSRPMGTTVKYNPHLWSDDELRDIFVIRHGQLAELLNRICSTPPNVAPQAMLVMGARGMGKTTLLRRLALAVRDEPELSRQWLPLSFPEEQYTVSSLGEFWRNVLDALIDALEQEGASRSEIAELDGTAREVAEYAADSQAEHVLALLAAWSEEHQRRLLLLIDSTDLLLEGLKRAPTGGSRKTRQAASTTKAKKADPARADSALWQLRSTLLQARHLMWVGATYQSLESQHAYDDAFHDFFDLVPLPALSLSDMREALVALAGRFGMHGNQTSEQAAQAMRHELDTRPERLQALRAITGGNPRTTAILYDLFVTGLDGDLHSDLRGLLDLMTPLYKARMEQLSEQPRKLVAHVMEAWEPISLRDLAQVSGIPSSTVSSQLVRLEQDGLVQKTQLSGTRRSGFQVTERFFNIWFLMRHASRRVRQRLIWLVEFMRLWYRRDELEDLALRRTSFHQQSALGTPSEAEYSRAVARAMPDDHELRIQLDYAVYRQARQRAEATNQRIGDIYPELFDLQGEDKSYLSGEQCHERFLELKTRLLAMPAEPGVDVRDWARRVLGAAEATLREKRALAAATGTLTVETSQRLHLFPGRSLTRKLLEHAFDQQTLEAVEAAIADGDLLPDCADLTFYRAQIAAKFGHHTKATQAAFAVFLRTADKASRLEVARSLEEMTPARAEVRLLLGRELALIEPEQAARWLAESVKIDPTLETWAELTRARQLQWHFKRYDEAERAYQKAIALDKGNVWAWEGLGRLLGGQLRRFDEAEEAYRKAIALDGSFAAPWIGLGRLLRNPGRRYTEAEVAFRKGIALDEANVLAWTSLGGLLQHDLKLYDESEAAYRQAIAIDDSWVWAWHGLGNLLQNYLRRYDEAELAYRKAISLDDTNAFSWSSLGSLLHIHMKRYHEAEASYRRAIALDPDVAWYAWAGLGRLYYRLERYDEAEGAYRKAITLDGTGAFPWANLGNLLQYRLGRYSEAEEAYRKAISLDEMSASPWLNYGNLLKTHLKRYDEAEEAYRRAIALTNDGSASHPWFKLGNLLHYHLKRYEEAEDAYRKAIGSGTKDELSFPWTALGNLLQYHVERFGEAEEAYREAIAADETNAWAWENYGHLLLHHLKRYDDSDVAYRRVIALNKTDAMFWTNFGIVQDLLQRFDEAEAAYEKAIALHEASPWPWNGLGSLLHRLERYDDAEAAYRKAIARDEANPWVWRSLGALLNDHLKRYDQAATAFRKATILDEGDIESWGSLGNLLQDRLNRPDEAEAAYAAAEKIEPDNPFLCANHARLMAAQGRKDEATTLYRKAIALLSSTEPGRADRSPQLLLQAHLWLGNVDLARQALDMLAGSASKGDTRAFALLREQVFECHRMGIGDKLANLLASSSLRDFLVPFEMALRAAAEGSNEPMLGTPAEAQVVAREILSDLIGVTDRSGKPAALGH